MDFESILLENLDEQLLKFRFAGIDTKMKSLVFKYPGLKYLLYISTPTFDFLQNFKIILICDTTTVRDFIKELQKSDINHSPMRYVRAHKIEI